MRMLSQLTKRLAWVFVLSLGVTFAVAEADDRDPSDLAKEESYEESYEESHERAVIDIVEQYDIPITYDYISTLMRLPNAFGEGAACIVCHSSTDSRHSPRGLDLSSCEGIRAGSTEHPARKVITIGDGGHSLIRERIRNNRMPWNVGFDVPTDLPSIIAVRDWINAGAKNDASFAKNVLPLFKDPRAFGGRQACLECHMSNQEPPSFHELDLTSHAGILLGADSVAKKAEGLPPVKIVFPGDAENSPLYQRLVQNRMPAGVEPDENRDHPNIQLLVRWIDKGAVCD